MVIQLILSLSILVILHEGGHFFAAKFFKTKVEKFYLFFNPWFTPFKFKKGETEYGIGWLPFGGYVKIAGMIDESFDKEQLKGEVQPWEFRAKPAWQRLIIMLGGIIINVILGVIIYIFLTYAYGTTYLENSSVVNGIAVDSTGYKLGLRDGDRILKLGDKDFDKFDVGKFTTALILEDAHTITVERNNEQLTIEVPENTPKLLAKSNKGFLINPRIPYTIAKVQEGSIAEKAGLKPEDNFIAINDQPVSWDNEVRDIIKNNADKEIKINVVNEKGDTLTKIAKLDETGVLGVFSYGIDHYFDLKKQKYSFSESIPIGIKTSWNFITGQIKAFGKIFQGKIPFKDSVGSVISMGKLFGPTWDTERFWTMTAMLSLLLAFINLLPIPGLDGGHAVFAIYEMVTGRKPSDKVVEIATTIGFILLVLLMILALGNDIRKLF